MNLLWLILIYMSLGGVEWYLACRRTLAVARGETIWVGSLVFIESVLGLMLLSYFIRSNDPILAIAYALGGAVIAVIVMKKSKSLKESL